MANISLIISIVQYKKQLDMQPTHVRTPDPKSDTFLCFLCSNSEGAKALPLFHGWSSLRYGRRLIVSMKACHGHLHHPTSLPAKTCSKHAPRWAPCYVWVVNKFCFSLSEIVDENDICNLFL